MNMMTKKLIAIRVSQATKAKLDDLAQLYGTQTEAVAVALDRLHSQSIGTSERGESRMTTYRVTFKENGSLFVPSDGRAAILDEWTDLDASTEKNVVIEYTIDDECSNYFEHLLENSEGVAVWDKKTVNLKLKALIQVALKRGFTPRDAMDHAQAHTRKDYSRNDLRDAADAAMEIKMKRPTCVEIAEDFELWGEYVDPHAIIDEEQFNAGSAEKRLAIIHDLCPMDCNCGWIETQLRPVQQNTGGEKGQ